MRGIPAEKIEARQQLALLSDELAADLIKKFPDGHGEFTDQFRLELQQKYHNNVKFQKLQKALLELSEEGKTPIIFVTHEDTVSVWTEVLRLLRLDTTPETLAVNTTKSVGTTNNVSVGTTNNVTVIKPIATLATNVAAAPTETPHGKKPKPTHTYNLRSRQV